MLALLRLLQSGQRYNSRQLAERCGVHRRTIFRDLATLQEAGIHVRYDEVRETYWLPHQTFLPPTDLTVDEVLALLVVCRSAGESAGVPFQQPAFTAAVKLANALPAALRREVDRPARSLSIRVDARNPLAGEERWYRFFVTCLSRGVCARITYHSLADRRTLTSRLSPYAGFFSRRSWYVIGRSSWHRAIRTFNLGRLLDAVMLDDPCVIPPRFTLEQHFGLAWQMIRKKPRADVVVRFERMVARNVAEVLWHKTQRCELQPDGSLLFSVTVDGFDEIAWWILGYGDQAEALEPPELREILQQRITKMAAAYGPSNGEVAKS
jgi:proteasome accessory factor B